MAYHVGRACAVAGYAQLFQELDILPDVHIAEEARECGNLDIHELIVSQSVRYSIMNEYTRTIRPDNLKPAVLNGDTAVCWMLDIKEEVDKMTCNAIFETGQGYLEALFSSLPEPVFNITADRQIGEHTTTREQSRLRADRLEVQLLTEPLPLDLPTVQKDLLICMAAYKGDIDRHVRLRRPQRVYGEYQCLI